MRNASGKSGESLAFEILAGDISGEIPAVLLISGTLLRVAKKSESIMMTHLGVELEYRSPRLEFLILIHFQLSMQSSDDLLQVALAC